MTSVSGRHYDVTTPPNPLMYNLNRLDASVEIADERRQPDGWTGRILPGGQDGKLGSALGLEPHPARILLRRSDVFEPRIVKLKDHREVVIRPMTRDDLEGSLAFFRALPEENRLSLRRDVTMREVVEGRIHELEEGTAKRLVGVLDDTIVADGALDLPHFGWERHVAELRLYVASAYQRQGLGMLMAGALCELAASAGIEDIIVRMMASQTAALRIFQKLGFRKEVVLHDYVKDAKGNRKDLVLMRSRLESLWHNFEDYIHETDLRSFRMH